MIIPQLLIPCRLENIRRAERIVRRERWQRPVVLVVVPVHGQPLVADEPRGDAGLDVVDGHAQQVPGAVVAQARVVLPDAEVLQLA